MKIISYVRGSVFALLLIAVIIAISGCQGKTAGTSSTVDFDNLLGVGLPIGADAPEFELKTVDDLTIKKGEMKGKIVVLQGFAPGCPSCEREMRTLSKLYPQYKDRGLEIISVDAFNDKKEDLKVYIGKTFGASTPWHWALFNPNLLRDYNFKALETTVVIDRSDKVSYVDGVLTDEEKLRLAIEKVI